MNFKSFVKKALMTALTLAVCIPVILKVASANASEGATLDASIQFLDANGNVITSADPGQQVTVRVTVTPKYADGTSVDFQKLKSFGYNVTVWDFTEDEMNYHVDGSTGGVYTRTFTARDTYYIGGVTPVCTISNGEASFDSNSVSGNEPDYSAEMAYPSFSTIEASLDITTKVEPPASDCDDPSDSGSSGGDSGSSGGSSSSSGSSGSSDSAPAAGGGAAAPAGGGAAGNAGPSTVGGVYTAKSMNSVAITSPVATVAAAAGLSEADVAAGTNVRTYICDSRNREMKDALKSVADTNGRSIVAYIDIDLYTITKAGVVTNIRNTVSPVTMTFGLPGSLANAGHTYSVLCLNPDGTPAIFEDIDTNNATITINATAFGTYAIMINQ